jgi:hypothetical protein
MLLLGVDESKVFKEEVSTPLTGALLLQCESVVPQNPGRKEGEYLENGEY